MVTIVESVAALTAETTKLLDLNRQVLANNRGVDGRSLTNRGNWNAGPYVPGDYVFAQGTNPAANSLYFLIDTIPYASTIAPRGDAIHWLELPALSGADGRALELQVNSTHIQWRLAGGTVWLNLIPLATLKGEPGVDSVPARWFLGTGVPSSAIGNNGDFYLEKVSGDVYGPKTNGAWGSATANMKGAPGTGSTSAAWATITGLIGDNPSAAGALAAKEDFRAAGSASQYWRGNKTLATLDKAAVGLDKVNNTSDAEKPLSTAATAAIATATAAIATKQDKLPIGSASQYIGGDGAVHDFPANNAIMHKVIHITNDRNAVALTDDSSTLVFDGEFKYTVVADMPVGFGWRAVPPRNGGSVGATIAAGPGVTINFAASALNRKAGDNLMFELVQIGTNEYLLTGVGATAAEQTAYFPYIGPVDRWFPTDAVYVPYSNRANLQSIINTNKRVRLEGRSYGVPIVLQNGSEIYGIPLKTFVSSVTLGQDASNVVSKGVGGPVTIPANSGDHSNCVMGVATDMNVYSEGTIHDSMFLRTFRSSIRMNNAAGGKFYNMRFINPQSHGAGADGHPALEFIGQSDFSSHTVNVLSHNALTPSSDVLEASWIDGFSISVGDMERGPEHQNNGKPTYNVTDSKNVRIRSLAGNDPLVPAVLGLTRVKNAYVTALTQDPNKSDPSSTKFKFTGVENLVFWTSLDSDRMVDDGLPGTANNVRVMAEWKNGQNGVRYNGGYPNQVSGTDAAAVFKLLVEDQYEYRPWGKVAERPVADLLGPNWKSIAAAAPDMTAELQAVLNTAGVDGIAVISKIYFCASSLIVPRGCTLVGNGSNSCGVVMKSQSVPMFTYNFDGSGGFVMIDMTLQGGKSWIEGTKSGTQVTDGFFLYCTIRDQAEAAIDLQYTYAWDNNYFEGCNFVNCGIVMRTVGRLVGAPNSIGETTDICYCDKHYFMRCQFMDMDYMFYLRPKRSSGGFMIMDCGIFRTKKGVYELLDPNASGDFQFLNSLIKDCKAVANTRGDRALFSYQGTPDTGNNYIGCVIENADAEFLFYPGSRFEGVRLVKGNFTGKMFCAQPLSDPREGPNTILENCDLDTVPSGISTAALDGTTPVRSSYIVVNTRMMAPEDAYFSGALSVMSYNTNNTPWYTDDTLIRLPNWLPGTPRPTSKIMRDRIVIGGSGGSSGGTVTPTPQPTDLIALVHMSGIQSGTRPATITNSVSGGVVINNWGDNRVPGALGTSVSAPYGEGLYTESSVDGRCMIGLDAVQTITADFLGEYVIDSLDADNYVAQFGTNGDETGEMHMLWVAKKNSAGKIYFVCVCQKAGVARYTAFETAPVDPITVAGITGYHLGYGRLGGFPIMLCNGARVGIGSQQFAGTLTGYFDLVGAYNRVAERALGGFRQRVGEARLSRSVPYPGLNYSVPSARF